MAMQIQKLLKSNCVHLTKNYRQLSSSIFDNKLTTKDDNLSNTKKNNLHVTIQRDYPQAKLLPLPINIDPNEVTRFSPNRTRDITNTAIYTHQKENLNFQIDITLDNHTNNNDNGTINTNVDPHIQSYDCHGAISLNAVMQSTVPDPFGGMHKFTHLNMPGGQWEQGSKYMGHDLQSSHYINLRKQARMDWSDYSSTNKNDDVTNKGILLGFISEKTNKCNYNNITIKRDFSSDSKNNNDLVKVSRKELLKKAIKEYGTTVIVFHVGISLISLGIFYILVSSGLDIIAILEYFNLSNNKISNNLATGASTFVVAYAIHKIFAPVRISITLGATPFIVKYLRSKGILKKPISK